MTTKHTITYRTQSAVLALLLLLPVMTLAQSKVSARRGIPDRDLSQVSEALKSLQATDISWNYAIVTQEQFRKAIEMLGGQKDDLAITSLTMRRTWIPISTVHSPDLQKWIAHELAHIVLNTQSEYEAAWATEVILKFHNAHAVSPRNK